MMEVKLLNHTQDGEVLIERAGRVCHGSEMKDSGKFIKNLVTMGHESVLEHASATFEISGISRACSHQIVRHRLAAYSQESQRYVEMGDDTEFVLPMSISKNLVAMNIYGDFLRGSKDVYRKLIDLGIPKEDARFVLPNATPTRLIWTANLREWRHIIKVRCDKAAQWEIRTVCREILWELSGAFPNVFTDQYEEFFLGGGESSDAAAVCTIERCVEDQGQYNDMFGPIVVCTRCNRVRQCLNQCKCGAP